MSGKHVLARSRPVDEHVDNFSKGTLLIFELHRLANSLFLVPDRSFWIFGLFVRADANDEQMASEAYAVLIRREAASRRYPKSFLAAQLVRSEVRVDFLKLTLEHDDSADLRELRKALGFVAGAVGWSKLSKRSGISRMSLYRMLGKDGNPRLDTLVKLLKTLKLHFWVVDRGFIRTRKRVIRPKDILGSDAAEAARWITESSHGTHPHWDEGPG